MALDFAVEHTVSGQNISRAQRLLDHDAISVCVERDSDTVPCGASRMWVRELAQRGSSETDH